MNENLCFFCGGGGGGDGDMETRLVHLVACPFFSSSAAPAAADTSDENDMIVSDMATATMREVVKEAGK